MTVTAGERHDYQRDPTKQPAPPGPKAGADPIAELAHEPSVDDAVKVIAANPARRDAIMATLHQRMGNAFVQQVIVAMTARPAPNALPLSIHPAGQSKTDAILQDNAAALDKGRRLGELGSKHLSQITSLLIPAYGKARDQLDVQGVAELGGSIIGSLQLARASTEALADQLALVKMQSQPGADIAIEGAEAGQDAVLQSQLTINRGLITAVELAVLTTLTPTMFRGQQVAPAAPVMKQPLDPIFDDELARTVMALAFVARTRKAMLAAKGTQRADAARMARFELRDFHRPLDLEFVHAALVAANLWEDINAGDPMFPGFAPAKPTGPLAFETCSEAGPAQDQLLDSRAQAKRTGWMTDTGNFDTDMVRTEIRLANTESALTVYSMISSADGEARVKLLDQLDREGILDLWLAKLPWHYTKELHDSLPHGNGAIKSRLQKYFLVEGKWGTYLGEEEYHAPSLTKMIREGGEHLGSVGSTIVNGLDDVLNVATLGFHHSYGEAHDEHAEGMITDDEYQTQIRQITARTTVGMAVMMATGGLGEAVAPGAAATQSVARTMLAGGVEAGTFATTEMMAMDATDVATGAKDQMGSMTDYLKVYALSGVMGAGMSGATAALSGRTAAKYLPKEQMTRGQRLSVENPRLAHVIDQVGPVAKGGVAEIRIRAADVDALEQRGIIDASSAQKLRAATAEGGTARATVRITDELNQPGLVSDNPAFEVNDAQPIKAGKTNRISNEGDSESPAEEAADAKRAKLADSKTLNFVKKTGDLPKPSKTVDGIPVGRVIKTATEGHDILDKLAIGDKSALEELGVKTGWRFKPAEREWVLGKTKDGYVVYAGGAKSVRTPHDVDVVGHTHPSHLDGEERLITGDQEPTFADIEHSPKTYNAHAGGLLPSASDVESIGEGGEQIVHTRFRAKGDRVVNPDTEGAGGQINITISNVRRLPTKVEGVGDFYEATFTARAKGEDQPMWTKTVTAKRMPGTDGRYDKIYFDLPEHERMLLSTPP